MPIAHGGVFHPEDEKSMTIKTVAAALRKCKRNRSWIVLEVCYCDCPKAGWNALSLYMPEAAGVL